MQQIYFKMLDMEETIMLTNLLNVLAKGTDPSMYNEKADSTCRKLIRTSRSLISNEKITGNEILKVIKAVTYYLERCEGYNYEMGKPIIEWRMNFAIIVIAEFSVREDKGWTQDGYIDLAFITALKACYMDFEPVKIDEITLNYFVKVFHEHANGNKSTKFDFITHSMFLFEKIPSRYSSTATGTKELLRVFKNNPNMFNINMVLQGQPGTLIGAFARVLESLNKEKFEMYIRRVEIGEETVEWIISLMEMSALALHEACQLKGKMFVSGGNLLGNIIGSLAYLFKFIFGNLIFTRLWHVSGLEDKLSDILFKITDNIIRLKSLQTNSDVVYVPCWRTSQTIACFYYFLWSPISVFFNSIQFNYEQDSKNYSLLNKTIKEFANIINGDGSNLLEENNAFCKNV